MVPTYASTLSIPIGLPPRDERAIEFTSDADIRIKGDTSNTLGQLNNHRYTKRWRISGFQCTQTATSWQHAPCGNSEPLLLIVYSFDAASRANPKSPSTSASFPFRRYLLTRLLVPLRVVADCLFDIIKKRTSFSGYSTSNRVLSSIVIVFLRFSARPSHPTPYRVRATRLPTLRIEISTKVRAPLLSETFYACQAALLHPDNTNTGQQHTRQTPYQNLSAEDTICPGTGTWKNPETGVLVGGLLNVALWFQSLKLGLSLSSRYWQSRASTGKSVAHVGFGVLILLEIKLLLGLGAVTPNSPLEYKLRGSIRATTPLCQGREGKRYQNEDFDASVHSAQGPLTADRTQAQLADRFEAMDNTVLVHLHKYMDAEG
ncbi:hypothetical protein M752DRAFT_270589 [Aspergillus phoenicis ATCC 13157]|uniref:Uncharacterized protein n=1 Tax=Aspergillus phoenicis ATCC 13157 TaxID=1353007 RepID=A0A370P6J3_ASPPH|nr:hypothetical protein M752DRAFT_270589 [Aspergillus phoenicis ATCC 13157]